ncbi:MAG: acetyl-CoA carboxylase biotin carboxylase subunit, partial [Myxococcales bacterium]|nr:acetyl-CoA carboxylase biotin carboxylase subunit [Myxococcales bacterium]
MNTRLQVEHPVTELVYGVDLVELQVRVAAGQALPYTQADIQPRGHAVECRIYAEDPVTFLPSPGRITALSWPEGPGVRVDAGVDASSTVPMAYDPMVAKLCTWGSDRAQAIRRMRRALDETSILGITTNIGLHHRVLTHPAFVAGRYDTGVLSTPLPDGPTPTAGQPEAVLAAVAIARHVADERRAAQGQAPAGLTGWKIEGHERMLRGG